MYKCPNCEYTKKSFFGLCPKCKTGVGEVIEDYIEPSNSRKNKNKEPIKFQRVRDEVKQDKIVKTTKFKGLNRILSTQGGFVEQQIVAIGAAPGTGKSTLCAQICDENSMYIGTEESFSQINSRFLRVNKNANSVILDSTNIDTIIDAINSFDGNFVVIDSLNQINNGQDWYTKQAQNVVKLTSELKKNNKCAIIISQVTKSGEMTGMQTIAHTVDTVLYFERSETNGNLILSSNKNRFGEIGSVAIFEHEESGLKEISGEIDYSETEVGSTYASAQFGYRSIDIIVEALVTSASGNYGQKKANGINYNRLNQIVGVIQYNASGASFSDKDIYVAISNGLSINDSKMDLAIANSILSSYYRKESKFKYPISGEISLNGRIKNSNVKDVTHIKDLIELYRK